MKSQYHTKKNPVFFVIIFCGVAARVHDCHHRELGSDPAPGFFRKGRRYRGEGNFTEEDWKGSFPKKPAHWGRYKMGFFGKLLERGEKSMMIFNFPAFFFTRFHGEKILPPASLPPRSSPFVTWWCSHSSWTGVPTGALSVKPVGWIRLGC